MLMFICYWYRWEPSTSSTTHSTVKLPAQKTRHSVSFSDDTPAYSNADNSNDHYSWDDVPVDSSSGNTQQQQSSTTAKHAAYSVERVAAERERCTTAAPAEQQQWQQQQHQQQRLDGDVIDANDYDDNDDADDTFDEPPPQSLLVQRVFGAQQQQQQQQHSDPLLAAQQRQHTARQQQNREFQHIQQQQQQQQRQTTSVYSNTSSTRAQQPQQQQHIAIALQSQQHSSGRGQLSTASISGRNGSTIANRRLNANRGNSSSSRAYMQSDVDACMAELEAAMAKCKEETTRARKARQQADSALQEVKYTTLHCVHIHSFAYHVFTIYCVVLYTIGISSRQQLCYAFVAATAYCCVSQANLRRAEVRRWADAERTATQEWCDEQKRIAATERKNATKQAQLLRAKAAKEGSDTTVAGTTSSSSGAKARAEIDALKSTIEVLRSESDTAKKRARANEKRLTQQVSVHLLFNYILCML
jgi:hypothetical protein